MSKSSLVSSSTKSSSAMAYSPWTTSDSLLAIPNNNLEDSVDSMKPRPITGNYKQQSILPQTFRYGNEAKKWTKSDTAATFKQQSNGMMFSNMPNPSSSFKYSRKVFVGGLPPDIDEGFFSNPFISEFNLV